MKKHGDEFDTYRRPIKFDVVAQSDGGERGRHDASEDRSNDQADKHPDDGEYPSKEASGRAVAISAPTKQHCREHKPRLQLNPV